MTFGVYSEVGKLRKVLVCRPGLAQLRLTPANCRDLLFDDVFWVSQAKTAHYAFVNAMREQNVDVLEMHELLAQVLNDGVARNWILERKLAPDFIDAETRAPLYDWLNALPAPQLADTLIGGVMRAEL